MYTRPTMITITEIIEMATEMEIKRFFILFFYK